MLQALASIAIVAVVASTLLANALAQTKIVARHLAARASVAGLARGTDDFVTWAQRYVAAHGAAAAWPTANVNDATQPICASAGDACTATLAVTFAVTGGSAQATSGTALARNLQGAVHENRIAGTITATVTATDGTTLSRHTRLATVRVFDASPYAVLTGIRDAGTIAGGASDAEGDTAGTRAANGIAAPPTPDPARPAADVDTTIAATMTCANSATNADPAHPFADDNAPGNDAEPWGLNGAHAFEAPCQPAYAFAITPPVPADARAPVGATYDVGSFANERWTSATSPISGWSP